VHHGGPVGHEEFIHELVEEVILQLIVAGDIRVPADQVAPLEGEVYEAARRAFLREQRPAQGPWAALADEIIRVLRASQLVEVITAEDHTLRWKILRITALPVATEPLRPVPGDGGSLPPPLQGGGGAPAEARVSDDPPSRRRSEPDPNRREKPDSEGKGPPRKR